MLSNHACYAYVSFPSTIYMFRLSSLQLSQGNFPAKELLRESLPWLKNEIPPFQNAKDERSPLILGDPFPLLERRWASSFIEVGLHSCQGHSVQRSSSQALLWGGSQPYGLAPKVSPRGRLSPLEWGAFPAATRN